MFRQACIQVLDLHLVPGELGESVLSVDTRVYGGSRTNPIVFFLGDNVGGVSAIIKIGDTAGHVT